MRRKQIKYAPTYWSGPYKQTEEEAYEWLQRMRLKMGPDYTYRVRYREEYDIYHGELFYTAEAEEGYIIK